MWYLNVLVLKPTYSVVSECVGTEVSAGHEYRPPGKVGEDVSGVVVEEHVVILITVLVVTLDLGWEVKVNYKS